MRLIKDDVSIVLAGEAGQGIQSIESILTKILKKDGLCLFSTSEFMSRIRGGVNSTEIRVSSSRVAAYIDRIDILVALHPESLIHLQKRISKETLILGEKEKISAENLIDVPLSRIALDLGNIIYSNSVAVGMIAGFFNADLAILGYFISQNFKNKSEEIQNKNVQAGRKGYELGRNLAVNRVRIDITRNKDVSKEMVLNGSEAVALGALAGGCDYTCAYPMSPSTGVLTAMAEYSKSFDVIVEQVEDEVGVVNMALGAWYAGARALVTTSGGGFDLMAEGLSLCGMIESPLVIHLSQRPGPATGLPTRTEQGDLNLALYAGHGDFTRLIYAPGTLEEAFYLTQKAFEISDKYQAPVFVLTDQFFVDSYYSVPKFDFDSIQIKKAFVKTGKDYKRYALIQDSLSPRGIPGFGEGLVGVDSDEHDEEGHITEDLELRVRMVDKRLSKYQLLEKEIIPPKFEGNPDFNTLVISWGSTYYTIKEALDNVSKKNLAFLHFSQIFPLPKNLSETLKKAKKLIVIEGNSSGQFAQLLKLHTGREADQKILKYNGMPFSVEEIEKELEG